MSYTISDE